jgi:2-dehydro-3-deoxyphosphogluconate aldolase/(4S)-4-hydroxy-2-oxoglutarate aldolase
MRLRTIAILRALDAERAADVAERCWAIGMDLVEVPVQGDAGWAALESVARRAGGRAFGAGTVLTPADAHRAAGIGASVVISPGIHPEVVEAAAAAGALALPGVMTPTDVGVAHGWLGALRGPFPAMDFVAVGGVDPGNAAEYLRAGARGVAFGASIEALLAGDDPAAVIAELHTIADGRRPHAAPHSA